MKKILFCASTSSHINNFHLPYLKAFYQMGYEVHVATNDSVPIQWASKVFVLPFCKKLLSPRNILAIYQAFKLLKAQRYQKISVNTTLASIILRTALLFLKVRPRIYNIVHGYLFNQNSGLKKYLYLIPELIVSRVTDIVMVMNLEDFNIAKKYKLYKERLNYIDGMGVDPSRFRPVSLQEKSKQKNLLGFKSDDFLFVYAAEFSKRKNQKLLIKAFSQSRLEKAHLLLAGDGRLYNECKKLAKGLGQDKIHFLGYIDDVPTLYTACDVAVSTSMIEGLPFNIIEAIGSGLPVVASNIKGHRELVEQKINGLLFESQDEKDLIACLKEIYSCGRKQRSVYGKAGIRRSKTFLLDNAFDQIINVYTEKNDI